jgi:hypothetical protein
MRYSFFAFPDPFNRNHCVPLAWTHLSGGGTEAAMALAATARVCGVLSARGWAKSGRENWWAKQVGMAITRYVRFRRDRSKVGRYQVEHDGEGAVPSLPTLATFRKLHPTGRFLVNVRGHAVALIDGKVYGHWAPRSRVLSFAEVVPS